MEGVNNSAVVLRGLRKSFGSQTVLNSIDLEVAEGETLAVLGRSGTGKSVLLRLIIGLQKPDEGSIQVHGEEITSLTIDHLNGVLFIDYLSSAQKSLIKSKLKEISETRRLF